MPSYNDSHIDAARVLLQAKGIKINYADKNGCNPLHLDVVYRCVDIIKVLSKAKWIDINAANEDRQTPFHLAASLGRTDIVKVILQAKEIDVNARYKNGCTPLLWSFTQHKIQHEITDITKAVGISINVTAPAK
ncbi:hypothetical protein TNCV_2461611 [Trichonephila clavipes]|nr:hypothetical protein TNCV_2461611 [Trichonephila clavipes]